MIFDEFYNNLRSKTANDGGTSEAFKYNILTLMNFCPLIAEDNEGKMVELDVNQVLTIPKMVKSQEAVRRGFMSDLLFQNISGIFASTGALGILEQLEPVDKRKKIPRKMEKPIVTKDIQVDEYRNGIVEQETVVKTTNTHFGPNVYSTMQDITDEDVDSTEVETSSKIVNVIARVAKVVQKRATIKHEEASVE